MRIITILLLLYLLAGCQYDPHAHLYTTHKPAKRDVAGHYFLSNQTITDEGLSALKGMSCTIDLRNDGTFTVNRVPPDIQNSPSQELFNKLVSGSGTWNIDFIGVGSGETTYWGIQFDSQTYNIHSAHLTGEKPPFGLIFTLGDPDSGYSMIFERDKD